MREVLMKLFFYGLATFYGSMVMLRLFIRWIVSPREKFWRVKKRPTPPECLNDPILGDHHFIQLKDIKLHYVEKGDKSKPLMLFLHGFPEFWYSWRHQIKEFSKDYWTVAVDMRGYGDSEKPVHIGAYKTKHLVNDVKDLIEGLDRKNCILVAHDWGGVVAWEFLSLYPQMVETFIIMNAPHTEVYKEMLYLNKKQFYLSWYTLLFQLPYLPEFLMRIRDMDILKVLTMESKNNSITEADVEAYKFTLGNPGAFTGPINYYRANVMSNFIKKCLLSNKKISVPGLLLFGENESYLDEITPYICLKFVDNAKLEVIKGANHFIQQDDPVSTNSVMRKYLGT